MKNAKWIWHYGDYEIYHNLLLHSRRQEFGADFPPFWALHMPHQAVVFKRDFNCNKEGYLRLYTNGIGCLFLDGKLFKVGDTVAISKGAHKVAVRALKPGGLPCIYVESDICPSNEEWLVTHMTDTVYVAGCVPEYTDKNDNPEVFPFEYEEICPISKEIRCEGVLFDFGKETFAKVAIKGSDKSEIGVYYGESIEEALDCTESLIHEIISGEEEYELVPRAFRYIRLTGNFAANVTISALYEYLPIKDRGFFISNDDKLNKIWETCAYTLHLNSREFFLDGIKRDRWVWSGDAYQSYMINNYLYFDKEITRRTILGLRGHDTVEQHINTILDYSLYWIISIYNYYMSYDDADFLSYIFPKMKSMMDFCLRRLNDDGFIIGLESDWVFIDWAEIDKGGAVCAEQILFWKACKTMAEISNLLDEPSEEYVRFANNLHDDINKYFWDSELGAYIDCYETGKRNVTRHANIFAILYDFANPTQVKSIVDNVLNNDNVVQITTPFFKFFELDAICKTTSLESITEQIRSYWGGMLDLGATTIWEIFDPSESGVKHYANSIGKYARSLCHAWGAGPIYLFGRYYLGVYPTSPGYAKFNVEPNLGGLDSIQGSVPINDGFVNISLRGQHLEVVSTVPGGTLIWQNKTYDLMPNQKITL